MTYLWVPYHCFLDNQYAQAKITRQYTKLFNGFMSFTNYYKRNKNIQPIEF